MILLVSQQLWQDLFGVLVLASGVLAGLALLSSGMRARARPRGEKHQNTRGEIVLISRGLVLLAAAFWIATTRAFV